MPNTLPNAKKLPGPGYPLAAIDRLVSVIIPVADEQGNILPLAGEITAAMKTIPRVGQSYEIIFIDDLSTDASRDEIMQAMRSYPNVRLLCHSRRNGKGQSVRTGLRNARGEWIVTMDGDGQNDPADIKRLADIAWEHGIDSNLLVSGVRVNRADTNSKRIASRMANALRRSLLHDDSPDTGCALKMFRRDMYVSLPYFDNNHRYEPTLFGLYGVPVAYVPVNDRLRVHGITKYTNWQRALVGILDLMGVLWLQSRLRGKGEESVEVEAAPQLAYQSNVSNSNKAAS